MNPCICIRSGRKLAPWFVHPPLFHPFHQLTVIASIMVDMCERGYQWEMVCIVNTMWSGPDLILVRELDSEQAKVGNCSWLLLFDGGCPFQTGQTSSGLQVSQAQTLAFCFEFQSNFLSIGMIMRSI
jgi:hypothetical protein